VGSIALAARCASPARSVVMTVDIILQAVTRGGRR
jgi:hypothetical protein